jgi:hypothetical protein
MNNLAYSSQNVEKVGPKIEELIRKEVGATSALGYEVEDGGAGKTTAGTVLAGSVKVLFGGKETLLYSLYFNLTQPRPANLEVHVNKQGIGCHVGSLLYSTMLAKPASGEASLEAPKTFGSSKFTGDPATSQRLNANGDLVKRANKFARTESQSGGLTIKIDRFFKIVPQGSGSLLVIRTLARPTSMGLSATVDAKDFFDIAAMVEAAL